MNHKTKSHSFLLLCMFFTCSTFAKIDTNDDSYTSETQCNQDIETCIKKIIELENDSLVHMSPEERNRFNKIIASIILLCSEAEQIALYNKLKEKELIK